MHTGLASWVRFHRTDEETESSRGLDLGPRPGCKQVVALPGPLDHRSTCPPIRVLKHPMAAISALGSPGQDVLIFKVPH